MEHQSPDRLELLEKCREILADFFEVDPLYVVESASFRDDLDRDSLDLTELVMQLEDEYDIELELEELRGIVTIGDALDVAQRVISTR